MCIAQFRGGLDFVGVLNAQAGAGAGRQTGEAEKHQNVMDT
jgi:hypothetical protein